MRGYPGVSPFTVRYVTRGRCKSIDKETRKWAERHKGGKRVSYTYYKARIMIAGQAIFLGHYETAAEAAAAYQAAKAKFKR